MEYSQQPPAGPPPPAAPPPPQPGALPPDEPPDNTRRWQIIAGILALAAIALGICLYITMTDKNDAEDQLAALQSQEQQNATVSDEAIAHAQAAVKRLQSERRASVAEAKQAQANAAKYIKAQNEQNQELAQEAIDALEQLGYSIAEYDQQSGEATGVSQARLKEIQAAQQSGDTEQLAALLAQYDLEEVTAFLQQLQSSSASSGGSSGGGPTN